MHTCYTSRAVCVDVRQQPDFQGQQAIDRAGMSLTRINHRPRECGVVRVSVTRRLSRHRRAVHLSPSEEIRRSSGVVSTSKNSRNCRTSWSIIPYRRPCLSAVESLRGQWNSPCTVIDHHFTVTGCISARAG